MNKWIFHGLLLILLIIIQAVVYTLPDQTFINRSPALMRQLLVLQEKKASLDRSVQMIYLRRDQNFDELVQIRNDIQTTLSQIQTQYSDQPDFLKTITHMDAQNTQLWSVVEDFKTQLSLYLNLLRYLPTFIDKQLHSYPDDSVSILKASQHLNQYLIHGQYVGNQESQEPFKLLKDNTKINAQFNLYSGKLTRYYSETSHSISKILSLSFQTPIEKINNTNQSLSFKEKYQQWWYSLANVSLSIITIIYSLFLLSKIIKKSRETQELNKELRDYKNALDAHVIVTVSDIKGNIISANERARKASKYSQNEIIGKNHRMFKSGVHSDEFYKKLWSTVLAGNTWQGLFCNKQKDNTLVWLDTTIVPFSNKQGKVEKFVAIRTDVTHLKTLESKQKMLVSALNQAGDPIIITDTEALILYTNHAWLDMMGYTEKTLLGQHMSIFRAGDRPEEFYSESLKETIKGKVWYGELTVKKADGKNIQVERNVAPVFNDEGKVSHLIFVQRDISGRLDRQKEREHRDRLQSLGVMAGGIAHDFNNYLTSIMGHAFLAKDEEELDTRNKSLSAIEEASQQATRLTEQLLVYAGNKEQKNKTLELSSLLDNVLELLKPNLTSKVTRNIIPTKNNEFYVQGDIRQIEQVIMNLITNAEDAIRQNEISGEIDIELKKTQLDHKDLNQLQAADRSLPGSFIQITIQDNGCGMSPQIEEHLFDPFFTTREDGHGLGMSAVLGIVRTHAGGINFISNQGEGTKFYVAFPEYTPNSLEKTQLNSKNILQSHISQHSDDMGTALIIDDVSSIRTVACKMLQISGYTTIQAESGQDALDLLEKNVMPSIILLDLTMPGLSGAETLKEIRKKDTHVPIIIMSGFSHEKVSELSTEYHVAGFLKKPFSHIELNQLLSEIIT